MKTILVLTLVRLFLSTIIKLEIKAHLLVLMGVVLVISHRHRVLISLHGPHLLIILTKYGIQILA